MSDADEIALEHAAWALSAGFTPREVLESIRVGWPAAHEPTWSDVLQWLVRRADGWA